MFCSKTIKKKIVKYSASQLTTIQTSPLDKEPTDKDLPHLFVCWREGLALQQLYQGNNKCYLSISISYHLNIETKFQFF